MRYYDLCGAMTEVLNVLLWTIWKRSIEVSEDTFTGMTGLINVFLYVAIGCFDVLELNFFILCHVLLIPVILFPILLS